MSRGEDYRVVRIVERIRIWFYGVSLCVCVSTNVPSVLTYFELAILLQLSKFIFQIFPALKFSSGRSNMNFRLTSRLLQLKDSSRAYEDL